MDECFIREELFPLTSVGGRHFFPGFQMQVSSVYYLKKEGRKEIPDVTTTQQADQKEGNGIKQIKIIMRVTKDELLPQIHMLRKTRTYKRKVKQEEKRKK